MVHRTTLILTIVILCLPTVAFSQSAPKVRRIGFNGDPIADRLLPDDEVVVITPIGESIGGFYDQPPAELFKHIAQSRRSTIAVAEVTGVSGVLADEGSIVRTRFVGRVLEVVAASNQGMEQIRPGEPLEFSVYGGETVVRGVVVRTERLVVYPSPAKYLVFIDPILTDHGWMVVLAPLLVTGDALAPVRPAVSLFTGLSLPDMRRIAVSAR